MARHKWGPHPDAPQRPLHVQQCTRCAWTRTDYAEQGLRWEYRDGTGKFLTNRKQTWAAPPCPGAPESKKEER